MKYNLRKIREDKMLTKAELGRRAGISVLTVDRIERGYGCHINTKRQILQALEIPIADRFTVFPEEGAENKQEEDK